MRAILVAIGLLGFEQIGWADDQRAQVNYMIHCQGCHLPQAVSVPGNVPRMKDFVGYFLHSAEGREFVVQVPGVSTAPLDDEQLAELMNWILVVYSKAQLPTHFKPYSGIEIAQLRKNPLQDPATRRKEILEQLAVSTPSLEAELNKN